MINEKIKQRLVEFNPYWKGSFEIDFKPRTVLDKINSLLPESQIIALCGLRRTGKTTLLKKVIFDLLKQHPADDMLYFSFDDFQGEIDDVINAFKEIHCKEPRFLFFDEVQKVVNWAEKVKLAYDTKKYKIFLSGSESLFLLEGSKESLAGRIFELEVQKLTFNEYLGFVGKRELAAKPQLYQRELQKELENYLQSGGFPEAIGKTPAFASEYIRSMVEKVVFKDLRELYSLENPKAVQAILEMLEDNPGMVVDLVSLSNELGISRQTLSKYFDFLERAHLVAKLYNYSRNRITSEKRLKKFYPTFLSTTLYQGLDDVRKGKVIETLCVLETRAKFFWRDAYKNEVDIVIEKNRKPLPIEVKWRNDPSGHTDALEKFCKKYKATEALIITKNPSQAKQKNLVSIKQVPLTEFLLRQEH